ncbi:Methicillin resistance protein [Pseudopedobacter saltans DSM 12145]|uniref:Methicillin resistance protein n=1 Tax=Pseudopedobacter saltans (strain ATCC 51119 / DSM 12145 / JCM 21818 / CCUG 39354 / LMG 10337 / NBRC 100064 / NCIMB 13643) TaxID=762903 RepID=F0SDI3_PSESL|nr:peptidoglycan bridge formation glycyltransferase FemA/FemB family protein [Pseudopedobacter saltans]ADY53966.1 Methicillin resistance protein [Pseudopedobacter saltans DSM 12145]
MIFLLAFFAGYFRNDMSLTVSKKDLKEVFRTPIIQQTAFWSEVKKQQGFLPTAFDFKTENSFIFDEKSKYTYTHGDLLVLIQYINRTNYIAYVPYGPEIEPHEENQGKFLEELSEILRSYLPKGCILIRYDLAWKSHWAKEEDSFDETGQWLGPPEKKYQEFRLNFNTANWNLRKTNSDILPSNTIFLDLKKDQNELLGSMKPKTRYNINVSFRKGITVKAAGMDKLDVWYALYQETAVRNKITINNIDYFRTVLAARAEDSSSPAEVQLLIAEYNNVPLAAMFLVISGNRGTYLYGASSSSNRNLMATYALQWEAIRIARGRGCIEYDFFGVAPKADISHPLYGLYKFKTGFGGKIHHNLGCWDYPLDQDGYNHLLATEMHSQGYHL